LAYLPQLFLDVGPSVLAYPLSQEGGMHLQSCGSIQMWFLVYSR